MATLAHTATVPSKFPLNLRAVEDGLPLEALTEFLKASGVSTKDGNDIVIPARTLKHRRARHESLSRDESDKLARLIRIYEQTRVVFADKEKALWWLSQPQFDFEERTPLQMLRTELGARLVEETLVQIDEGMFG